MTICSDTTKLHCRMLPGAEGDSAGRKGKVKVMHTESEHMEAWNWTSEELGVARYCWIIAESRNTCLVTGVCNK